MGSRREPTEYKLTFPDLNDLEVQIRSLPLAEFFAVQRMQATADSDLETSEQLIRKVAEAVVSWNREDAEGQPIAPDFDGLCGEELPAILQIFQAWIGAMSTVPKTSSQNSLSTGTSPELSLAMDTVSEPLAS